MHKVSWNNILKNSLCPPGVKHPLYNVGPRERLARSRWKRSAIMKMQHGSPRCPTYRKYEEEMRKEEGSFHRRKFSNLRG